MPAHNGFMAEPPVPHVDVDDDARSYLDAHPSDAWVVAYDVHRCCGGGKICQVSIRAINAKDDPDRYAATETEDGTRLLVDRRAAARLPARFGLTVRGRGRWRHLDLGLDGEQWGDLLYS